MKNNSPTILAYGLSLALAVAAAMPVFAQRGGPAGQVPGRGGASPPPAPAPPSPGAQRPGGTPGVGPGRGAGPSAVPAPTPDARLVRERMKERKGNSETEVCPPPGVSPAPDRFDWDAWWETSGAAMPAAIADAASRSDLARVAVAVFRATIDDADPLVSEATVLALGAVAEAEDEARLIAMAAGPDESSRFAAVLSLAQHDALASRSVLRERLLDPKESISVRGAAALALGALRDDASAPELRAIAANAAASLDLRVTALLALGLLSDVGVPAAALGDGRAPVPVRCAAAVALGRTGEPAAADPLVAALGDANADVAGAAAAGLGSLGRSAKGKLGPACDRATAALARIVATHESAPVRGLAAIALGEMDGAGARPALKRVLRRDVPDVRAAAALGLGLTGDLLEAPALRALARARGAEEEAIVAAAAVGLGFVRDPAAVAELIKTLERDSRPWVRASAAESLGRLDAKAAVPALEKAVASAAKDPAAARAALLALARIDAPEAHAVVRRAASERADALLAAHAIAALGGSAKGGGDDVPFLATVARDPAEPNAIRAAAVRALARIAAPPGPSAIDRILENAAVIPMTDTIDIVFALR